MELFFSTRTEGKICYLETEEAQHCVKVLRHKTGDVIHIINGRGTLY